MPDVIYVYFEGDDFEAIEESVTMRIQGLVERHAWVFFDVHVVNQRREEGWELGLNLAFEPRDEANLPARWFSDIEATLACFASLSEALDLSFVIGFAPEGKSAEDIFFSSDDRAEIERGLTTVVRRSVLPSGFLRRTVRFDMEDGRAVAAIGDYRVTFSALFSAVFSLANGERRLDEIIQTLARQGLRGLPRDPTSQVLDAVDWLSREGFVTLVEAPSALPSYLVTAVSEQDAIAAHDEMVRDGFDPERDPRRRRA